YTGRARRRAAVRVAQSVEPPVVVREVAGSSPVSHPLVEPFERRRAARTAVLEDEVESRRPGEAQHLSVLRPWTTSGAMLSRHSKKSPKRRGGVRPHL